MPIAAAPAVGSHSGPEQQEEIVSLPSVKMLASKFSDQSRTRRVDSKVRFIIVKVKTD